MSKWEKSKEVLKYMSPMAWLAIEGAEKASKAISNASDEGLEQLKLEYEKQEIQMRLAQQQAKIEQELAIARRIDNAEEVEIEEFYDNSGTGSIDASFDQKTGIATGSIGGGGRAVTKRVYHFRGIRNEPVVVHASEGNIE